jgi:hypothetical protein
VEQAPTGELLLLLASAVPLGYLLALGLRERFSASNAVLILMGLGLIVFVSASRVFNLSVLEVMHWPGGEGPLGRQTVEGSWSTES